MASYRFESSCGHHRTGFCIRFSLPEGHEYREPCTLYYGCIVQTLLISSRLLEQIGFGWIQGTVGNGQRSSSATTYVGPDYINRPNLHILLHAHATKVLEATGLGTTIPTFNGVEFGTGPSSKLMISKSHASFRSRRVGQRWQVTARKEIILSAGVFNTPQLLMLSGIGDPAELTSLGIPTRVNLPSVGKNMTDHVLLGNPWRVDTNDTFDNYLAPNVLPQQIQEWNQTHQGPLSWTVANQMAWSRFPQNHPIIQAYGDPSPGPTSAHYQFIWFNGWAVPGFAKPEGNWMAISTNLISPTSRSCLILFTGWLGPHQFLNRWRGQTQERESV